MGEFLNFRSGHTILFGNVSASSRGIVMYIASARNFLVGRLSSTMVATINFRPDDYILPAWEKFLNFQSETAILLGKVSTSGRRIEIYLAEAFNFLLGRLTSSLLETIIIRPED